MLVITSISRGFSVGWVVDMMPGLIVVHVSIGQLVEDPSADMPGVVQGAGHLPGTLCALESFDKGSPDATGEKLGL